MTLGIGSMLKSKPFFLYLGAAIFILGWWWLAFHLHAYPSNTQSILPQNTHPSPNINVKLLHPFLSLSPVAEEREWIHAALRGDPAVIARLIADWDVEAHMLEREGLSGVERLSPTDFFRAQLFSRHLLQLEKKDIEAFNQEIQDPAIIDDAGFRIILYPTANRFFPQTYAAASLLLAIADSNQIVAIPKGLRKQTHLFPASLTDQIPLDTEDYSAETRYLRRPHLALVSHYSNPAAVQSLRAQGIPLFHLNRLDTPNEVLEAIGKIGHIVQRPIQAELLRLFVKAALQAIDNRMLELKRTLSSDSLPRILYVNYYTNFSIPGSKKLVSHFLNRMEINTHVKKMMEEKDQEEWNIPLTREALLSLDPDVLIVSSEDNAFLLETMQKDPAYSSLRAVRNKYLYFVDETIQQSPSQYMVLSYFDLYQALLDYTLARFLQTGRESGARSQESEYSVAICFLRRCG